MNKDLFEFSYENVWDALKRSALPIVLYGMGNGADKVLDEFERRGIKARGVMASEGFVRHQHFRGFTVKSERELLDELSDFTVALCFASSLPDVMDCIKGVSERHPLFVPNVPVYGDEIMDDRFLSKYKDQIEEAYALLFDERSRAVFKGVLDFVYTGRLPYLNRITSDKKEVFERILQLKDERYLDLGAYRGDTVEEFLKYSDGYEEILAAEPNEKNFRKLSEYAEQIDRITLLHVGISDRKGTMLINTKGGRMASLSEKSGREVQVTAVDELPFSPTYIKADIEGFEHQMLRGMQETLKRKPKLNIAAYHRTADFFTLIREIHAVNPAYRFYLRKHPYIPCWDLNLYAV